MVLMDQNLVFSLASALIGLIGLVWSLRNLYRGIQSRNWDLIDCEITDSEVEMIPLRARLYIPRISYKYSIGGIQYEGSRLRYGATWRTESIANGYCEEYYTGKITKVSVNPNYYGRSVLQPGTTFQLYLTIIVWIVLGAIGVNFLLAY